MNLLKNMKPIVAVILVLSFAFSASACGKTDTKEKPSIIAQLKDKIFNKDEPTTTTTAPYTEYYNEPVTDTVSVNATVVTQPTTKEATTKKATKPKTTSKTTTKKQTSNVEGGVSQYTATYNSLEQVVYYPDSLKSSKKTLPVIAFANGTGCSYTLYEKLLKEIAAGGYIVVANNETMSADGTAQISSLDFVLAENANKSSVLYKKVNTSKLGVAGHSQGGRSSVNAAVKDSRITCVVSLAGSNYVEEAEPLSTPAFFITGTKDMIVSSSQWVKPAYDVSKGPAVYASLKNGVHTTCCSDPGRYTYYILEWFDIYLKGDNGAKAIFKEGGKLSTDDEWTGFACKNV